MKKLFAILIAVIFMSANIVKAESLDDAKIYHFYQPTCPHCHEAINYINQTYPNIKMELINITEGKKNFDLFVKCAKKFNLGNQIGTPLFCMGDRYIMGWSEQQQKQFDDYVKEFQK